VPTEDRLQVVRDMYRAFADGDRNVIERSFADDLTFSSPVDVGLDRAGYFERCWPGAGRGQEFDFVRLVESGDEVIVTYEMVNPDGGRGRNTEVLTFTGHRISSVEVYFGWTVERATAR
jgi:ketosteroid isomerase-like protein